MRFNFAVLLLIPLALAAPGQPKIGDSIPGKYIVIMKQDTSTSDFAAHKEWVGQRHKVSKRGDDAEVAVSHSYDFGDFKGYAGKFDDATIKEIADKPEVAYVEQDKVASASTVNTQRSVPSWGLARISHRAPGATNYVYDSSAGAGITAYVIDSGVQTTHIDFQGRASHGANFITNEAVVDLHGHGTHVAGTIAGYSYGVAKRAKVVSVKVLNASGYGAISTIINGVQWVSGRATRGKSVVNISIEAQFSAACNAAVNALVNSGVPVIVAAGNQYANAANWSPASADNAITVGATDRADTRPAFSNYGSKLDIFAPGVGITSAFIGSSNTASTVMDGTSMASPHVCGLAAYFMVLEGLRTPSQVLNRLVSLSTKNIVKNPGPGSPNRLAFNNAKTTIVI